MAVSRAFRSCVVVGGVVSFVAAALVAPSPMSVPPAARADAGAVPGAPRGAGSALSAGDGTTCAVLQGGAVKCWGQNSAGKLGVGDDVNRGSAPAQMGNGLPAVDLGTGRGALAIAAGGTHVCALVTAGAVVCWGEGGDGQLGNGSTNNIGDGPNEMGNALTAVPLGAGRRATAIATGANHSCALLDDGSVKCWGDNFWGQLGQGRTDAIGDQPGEMTSLMPIDLGAGRTATAVSAGDSHTCALLDDGSVKCWGDNARGQLGRGDTKGVGGQPGEMGEALAPIDLGTERTALAVTAGSSATCALLDDATVACWGFGQQGRLGNGSTSSIGAAPGQMGDALVRVPLRRPAVAVTLARVGPHACAVHDDRSVTCWGYNLSGQLGIGNRTSIGDEPGEVASVPHVPLPSPALAVTAGSAHTCALLQTNRVTCWGSNEGGKLGLGSVAVDIGGVPGQVAGLAPIDLGTQGTAPRLVVPVPVVAAAPPKPLATDFGSDVQLQWEAPDNGGRAITGYRIEYSTGGDQWSVALEDTGSTATSRTLKNLGPGDIAFRVAAITSVGLGVWSVPSEVITLFPSPGYLSIVGLVPARLLDTRPGGATVDGVAAPAVQVEAGSVTTLDVVGRAGVPVGAAGVVLNVTVNEPAEAGYVTVFPCGAPRPNASNVNYVAGQTVPNAVVATIGDGGTVCLFSDQTTHLIVDVNAYLVAAPGIGGLVPARLLDTRPGGATIDGGSAPGVPVTRNAVTVLPVTGRGGVPDDAVAVVLNVTVNEPAEAGYVTVFPCGAPRPNASNVNYVAGQTVPNAVVATIGDGGTVCLFSDQSTHLIVDVNAFATYDSGLEGLVPARLLDTRPGGETIDGGFRPGVRLDGGSQMTIPVAGRGGVPEWAASVVLNVTVNDPIDAGFVTVWPCGAQRPNASNLNFVAGQTVANAVVTARGDNGDVCLYSDQTTHLIVDVNAYVALGGFDGLPPE